MFKVLIVEDHASMRESLTTALEAAGDFTVVGEVPNADYALDFCRHLHPDLVLIDAHRGRRVRAQSGGGHTQSIWGDQDDRHDRV